MWHHSLRSGGAKSSSIGDDDARNGLALAANLRFYEAHAVSFAKQTYSLNLQAVYAPFLRLLKLNAHVLDAGCGSGRDSAAFSSSGYQVEAIDGSPQMVQIAQTAGVRARVLTFQRMTYADRFDGIWACASLLHVPKLEIADVLRRFEMSAKENGILFVSLKEGCGERIIKDGRFFAYYSVDEFCSALCRTHWSLLDARRNVAENGQEWLNFLARKSSDYR